MMLEALAGRDPSLLWTAASINRCRTIIGILQTLYRVIVARRFVGRRANLARVNTDGKEAGLRVLQPR